MKDFFKQIWKMILDSNLLNVVGAIAILIIGWLLALLASKKISALIHKLNAKKTVLPDGTEVPQINNTDTFAGKVIYYIIMIFTVLGCFSVLKMHAAAEPLKDFASAVATYAPNIAGALLLAVIAWIVAGIIRSVVKTAMLKSKLNEHLAAQIGATDQDAVAEYTAKTCYYTVFLFFLPAILNVLKIYGITAPLQAMFEKVLTYIPNLIAAGAILAVGLFVAGIVRKAVAGLIIISRLNAFGETAGVSKVFGTSGLAGMISIVAYILVAIPVVISALTALKIKVLSDSVAGFFNKLLEATGDIIGAALIIFIAVLAGAFAASLVTQLTAALGLDRFLESLGFKSENKEKSTAPSVIVGKLTLVAIIAMAVLAACEILEFTQLAELIRNFVHFGGNVLLSVVVLLIGLWLANFAAAAVKGKCNELVTGAIRVSVIILTVALAVSNLKIGDSIVQITFSLILGAACIAAAIAFGIGGRETAAALLKSWMDKINKK